MLVPAVRHRPTSDGNASVGGAGAAGAVAGVDELGDGAVGSSGITLPQATSRKFRQRAPIPRPVRTARQVGCNAHTRRRSAIAAISTRSALETKCPADGARSTADRAFDR